MMPRARILRCGGLAAVALACGDDAHTNPYDPAVPVSISITGPDALFSFTVSIGAYQTYVTVEEQSGAQPFVPRTVPIGVVTHRDSIPAVVTQRLTKIRLRCPDVHACDTISVGGSDSVWVDGADALNAPVFDLLSPQTNSNFGLPIVSFAIRGTTIASVVRVGIRASTVTAKKAGSTWIVGTRGALPDSLRIVVR